MSDQPDTIRDEVVVTLEYTLLVDGEVLDSSRDSEPIQFIQGQGHIVPGLEKELYGMTVRETRMVVVPPAEGYGEIDPDSFVIVNRSEFPAEVSLETGIPLQVQSSDGDVFEARIASVEGDEVRLDLNHELAGKELHFDVEVVSLRQATPEEIAHGHIHDHQHGHGDSE